MHCTVGCVILTCFINYRGIGLNSEVAAIDISDGPLIRRRHWSD